MPDLQTTVTTSTTTPNGLPAGTWHVDPKASELTFRARGTFGLVPVHGTFDAYEGELEIDDRDVRGELRIQADSLDTRNKKRDAHPVVTFSVTELVPTADGKLALTGTLRIRDNELLVRSLVDATRLSDDRLRLETNISVDRAEAGVGWSKMGMIQGKAHLGASVVLVQI